ncbi:ribonuclease Oy-like protein [Leptotrombidium deliense]|uniref:Ribonuclease Oy-like protein n=1 Tax=Leptotrombidium deliense TaxID=299467 RepID=A0A443S0V7_9ACAR|nr:ribonuclease Oy-like protein [Leptotrombidium deliense]
MSNECIDSFVNNELCPKTSPFDYIVLSLAWSPGYCFHNAKCKNTPENRWTIHGTWPTNIFQPHPHYCCVQPDLDQKVINNLIDGLNKYWPSCVKRNEEFWQHEWNKHGTCSYGSPMLSGQQNYFTGTLKLYHYINLNAGLQTLRITPHSFGRKSAYALEQIRFALFQIYGKRVTFSCRRVKTYAKRKSQILHEIFFCFDKYTMRLINCMGKDDGRCSQKEIHYIKSE